MANHIRESKRSCVLVNLDPAAEDMYYHPQIDIRDLVSVEEVMDELHLGPNGALQYAMQYLIEEFEWMEEQVGTDFGDDYFIIDFPGQLELFTYSDVVPRLLQLFATRLHLQCCAVYLLESSFIVDEHKYFAGCLAAMSCMIRLEIPHVNVLSKMDLIEGRPGEVIRQSTFMTNQVKQIMDDEDGVDESKGDEVNEIDLDPEAPKSGYANTWNADEMQVVDERRDRVQLTRYLEADTSLLADKIGSGKISGLTTALIDLIDDFGMVSFFPLNIHDEDSIDAVMYQVDVSFQYGEDVEPKDPYAQEPQSDKDDDEDDHDD